MATLSLSPVIHAESIPQEIADVEISPKLKEVISAFGSDELEYKKFIAQKVLLNNKFLALDKAIQDEYNKNISEASELLKKERLSEALYSALEASNIFPHEPALASLITAIYIQMRDFTQSQKFADHAYRLDPYNPLTYFNKMEIYFVSANYKESLKGFEKLIKLEKVSPQLKPLKDLIQFKFELSHLGLARQKDTPEEAKKKHREFFDNAVNSRDILKDHTLLTYYGKIAQTLVNDEPEQSVKWQKEANFVFHNPKDHTTWLDTLFEFGLMNDAFR